MNNVLLRTDVYKMSHMECYAPRTSKVYSYLQARSSKNFEKAVFFGLQYYLKEYLTQPITPEMGEEFIAAKNQIVGSTSEDVTSKIRALCKLGYWPLKIKAVPEGTVINNHNVLLTIENTLPEFYWCVGFVESLLLKIWYSITVASCCFNYREIVEKYFKETVDDDQSFLKDYTVHDFGYRGDASEEGAAISGAAHLLSFIGSDTVPALPFIRDYYYPDDESMIIMQSVPASEHSVMCSFGREDELVAFHHMLDTYPNGIVSIVSDTFNIYEVCTTFMDKLKDRILTREGKTVIRPDCYDDKTEILTTEGWKLFKDLTDHDMIAQFHKDKSIDFVKPNKIIKEEYNGPMHSFFNDQGHIDLCVTPNHRLVTRNIRSGEIEIQFAETVKWSKSHYICAGKINGVNKDLLPHERFLIAFQADGSFENYDTTASFTGEPRRVVFNLKKQRKIDRIIEICKLCGYDYLTTNTPSRPEYTRVYVNVTCQPTKLLNWIELSKIDSNWCVQFIDEVSKWDSHVLVANNNQIEYSSCMDINARVVQTIAILAGYRTKYKIKQDNRKENHRDSHVVYIVKRDYISGTSVQSMITDYNGFVYSVQVPTGMLVVRRNNQISISGNSGNPEYVLLGDPNQSATSREGKGVIRLLDEKFGHTINKKGYKILNPKIGVIYGDSMNRERYTRTLERLKSMGYAASNLVIGVGGILRHHTRDTLGFALKATHVVVNGKPRDIEKDPITDNKKKSHKGLLRLVKKENGLFETYDECSREEEEQSYLGTVFLDGHLKRNFAFDEIRNTVRSYLN